MPKYIDADAFEESARLRLCKDCDTYDGWGCRTCWVDDMLDEIDEAPAADVIPRAEIFAELDTFIDSLCISNQDKLIYSEIKRKYERNEGE